jgi:hypothetical protein
VYPKVSGLSGVTKYTLTKMNTRWEATQKVMAAKLTRLTHRIAIQLHPVAESCTICSSRSRRPVRKLLGTLSYCYMHAIQMCSPICKHKTYCCQADKEHSFTLCSILSIFFFFWFPCVLCFSFPSCPLWEQATPRDYHVTLKVTYGCVSVRAQGDFELL